MKKLVKRGRQIIGFVYQDTTGQWWYAFGRPSRSYYLTFKIQHNDNHNYINCTRNRHKFFKQKMIKYIARKSEHIQEDIKRNWSSWNFGQEGFSGTYHELQDYLNAATDELPCFISGFEIYPPQIKDFEFGELYPNYWVAIDNVNAEGGLSGVELVASSLQDAINEANSRSDYFGEGICFDATEAKLIYSNKEIHIFEVRIPGQVK